MNVKMTPSILFSAKKIMMISTCHFLNTEMLRGNKKRGKNFNREMIIKTTIFICLPCIEDLILNYQKIQNLN